MKRGTHDHPKTRRLASLLGIQRMHAYGMLNALVEFVEQYAVRGDIGRWTDAEIAGACDWTDGDPEAFVAALVESRWLDRDEAHRLVLHDVHDHATDYWRRKAKKAGGFVTEHVQTESGTAPDKPGDIPDGIRTDSGIAPGIVPKSQTGPPSRAEPCRAVPDRDGPQTDSEPPARLHGTFLLPEPCPKDLVLGQEALDNLVAAGCKDVFKAHAHYVASRVATGKRRTDWHQDEAAWALNHGRYGCPCQAAPTPKPLPDLIVESNKLRAEAGLPPLEDRRRA